MIKNLIPEEAGLTDVFFNPERGEVEIEAKNLKYLLSRENNIVNKIFLETYWRPRVYRTPPLPSKVIPEVRRFLRAYSQDRRRFLRDVGLKIHKDPMFRSGRIRIMALGGFGEVGRSAILVQTPESNILLDLGIKPSSTQEEYPYLDLAGVNISDIDAVVVTHAHLDHIGFIPFLYKYGYRGPIYATEPTIHLMKLLLEDYVDVARKEGKLPPYSTRNIMEAILHSIPIKYGEVTDISPDVKLTLHNSGHVLGSAIVHLHIGNGLCNIVYTGDFKYGRTRLHNSADYRFPRVEVLIMESTYGGKTLESREETEIKFIKYVKETLERNGKVLIPVLAIGRAQEIMLVLADYMSRGEIPEVPVFIEGMIAEATAIYTTFPEYLSKTIREKILYHDENPFLYDAFEIIRDPRKRSEAIESGPAIILATSGMLTGGPVMEYLRELAPDKRNTLIFVSFQVEGTLGRRIVNGLRELTFTSRNGKVEIVKMKMQVEMVEGFSGHSDEKQLLGYLSRITPAPKTVILGHGEPSRTRALAQKIRSNKNLRKRIRRLIEPVNGDVITIV
ncbi:MAG TPA: beta-CASP ribonuclease aCPSF1 [Thermoproteales archaeon]|nr:beta-CASP ribonuclease aCPSF1 [Thermoproteales archaeon]